MININYNLKRHLELLKQGKKINAHEFHDNVFGLRRKHSEKCKRFLSKLVSEEIKDFCPNKNAHKLKGFLFAPVPESFPGFANCKAIRRAASARRQRSCLRKVDLVEMCRV